MHELKKCLYPLLSFLFLLNVSNAQESKYWIFFTDKGETGDIKPEDVLSPRAIERRANQGLSLDFYDFPVNQSYIGILENAGITTRLKSRWLNAASAFLTPHDAAWVRTLSFVKSVEKIASYELILDEPSALGAIMSCPEIEDAELPSRQLSMVGLDRLHEMGYSGNDVLVAVFDNGYLNVNELDGFKHLRDNDRIVATRDYVDGDESLYHSCEHCRHGTYVFSILAARDTALGLIGSAPDADFILLRTENDASETTQEEDNWVAAAEFADSMGAQVFTTSLGYFTFDGGIGNYGPNDRDGNTSIITRAADLAASRGIVVVNSAGNSGAGGLVMPADGDSVLAIGAVNPCAEYATFSSQGPSADGRVKPDISALGQGNFLIFPDGELRRGSGTSFSCPIASGLAACLIQAFPNATNTQIYDALKQSASQYDNPDEFLGYGIPNASLAMNILQSSIGEENQLFLFPNPTQDRFAIILPTGSSREAFDIQLIDMMGRNIQNIEILGNGGKIEIGLPAGIHPGNYIVRFIPQDESSKILWKKLVVEP